MRTPLALGSSAAGVAAADRVASLLQVRCAPAPARRPRWRRRWRSTRGAHWIDPTSLEAVGRAVDRIRTLSVFLVVTYRSEFEPPWVGQPHVTAIVVNRLTQREIAAMIDRVIGNKPLPGSVRQDILDRTD